MIGCFLEQKDLTSRPISNPPPSPAMPMAEGADHPSAQKTATNTQFNIKTRKFTKHHTMHIYTKTFNLGCPTVEFV